MQRSPCKKIRTVFLLLDKKEVSSSHAPDCTDLQYKIRKDLETQILLISIHFHSVQFTAAMCEIQFVVSRGKSTIHGP